MAPDPRKSYFTYVSGIKGSGKSEYAKRVFYTYPFDRLIIDVTHDVTDDLRKDGIAFHEITKPIPAAWPEWMRSDEDRKAGQMTLVFRPDMGDDEARDDIDRCIGISMRSKDLPTLDWLDEIGECCNAHWTGPSLKRGLHHGRHVALSLLMCGPRAKDVNPLCIGQADKVVTFRTLNRYDRQALAVNIGADQDEFDAMNKDLKKFEHMVWERETEALEIYAPIPLWRRGRNVTTYPDAA
jgi:hypothetical protein